VVLLEKHDNYAVIRFNRPERKNAINREVRNQSYVHLLAFSCTRSFMSDVLDALYLYCLILAERSKT